MPTLTPAQQAALTERNAQSPRKCRECDKALDLDYCERCDVHFQVGHGRGCRNADPGCSTLHGISPFLSRK